MSEAAATHRHSPFPALTWAEGTKTLAVLHGTSNPAEGQGMTPCTKRFQAGAFPAAARIPPGPCLPWGGLNFGMQLLQKEEQQPEVRRDTSLLFHRSALGKSLPHGLAMLLPHAAGCMLLAGSCPAYRPYPPGCVPR